MEIPEVQETYLVVLETENDVDRMIIQVEVRESFLKGEKSYELQARIVNSLQAELLAKPEVQLVSSGTIPVPEAGKAKRVIDKRSF